MTKAILTSGDLLADRRAQYAQMLAEAGDAEQASDLMQQALELVPGWAAGWMLLQDYAEKAGLSAIRLDALKRAAALDPDGMLGAQMQLAALGAGEVDAREQAHYVEALFDHYAQDFEASLLQRLEYAVPDALAGLIEQVMQARRISGFAKMVDLGCGTGLMGEHLRKHVSHLCGVDLSSAMVAQAERKGIYDRAEHAELNAFLARADIGADLITAADVFLYCDALPPIFDACFKALSDGGLFVFSIERHEGPEDQYLRPSLRYAHNAGFVAQALEMAGFETIRQESCVLRQDRGEPITGELFIAAKPLAVMIDAVLAAEPPRRLPGA